MFSRYKKQVPAHHQQLIREHGIVKPNWYVGAAEQPAVPRDPEIVAEVRRVKEELHKYARPRPLPAETADEAPSTEATTESAERTY